MRGVINKMYAKGTTEKDLSSISHMTQAIEDTSNNDEYDSDETMSQQE